MTISDVKHQVTVDSVPITIDTPTRVNIKKRRERVVYRTLSNRDNINISYLIGQDTVPSNNLFVSDRSTSITQNRIPSVENLQIKTTGSLTLGVDKFLVTSKFTVETPTRPETPLFFAHTLSQFNPTVLNFENKTLLSLEFADHNLKPIKVSDYVLDSSTGEVFNNLENSFNNSTTDFEITFVKYTVRTIVGSTQTITIHHELLSNAPIFSLADFDDIDSFGNIKSTSPYKYLVDEEVGGEQFIVTLQSIQKYAYKETPESRIKILSPTALDNTVPWNVRVTNGQFITSLESSPGVFSNYKYRIPEFTAQIFQPFPPYKFQPEEKAEFITTTIVKVAKNIVVNTGLGLFMDVRVKNSAGTTKFVYSNDPSKTGTLYLGGTLYYTDGVLSVDAKSGFIELTDEVRDDDDIIVTYFTEETEYELTAIDFNPINNLNILTQRVAIYIAPETYSSGDLDRGLFYLVINSLGEIVYSNQVAENPESINPSTQKMFSEDFFADGTPRHQFFYDKTSTASGLQSRIGEASEVYAPDFSFIDKYSVESILFNSSVTVSGHPSNFTENPKFLILGDIYVGENQSPESLSKFDVRVQGGGLKEDNKRAALEQQPEAAWYWDLNQNRPYPSVGAFLAEIPQSVHEDFGGTFTRDQIVDVVHRHMKIGGYAIVNTYGIDPVILEENSATTSGTIYFEWPSYGSDVSYDVYLSTAIDTGFVAQNSSSISDIAAGNSILLSGLSSSTKYYTQLGATKDDVESRGPVVSFTTTSAIT